MSVVSSPQPEPIDNNAGMRQGQINWYHIIVSWKIKRQSIIIIIIKCEQHCGITRDHVLCRCSEDTVVLFRCRCSAQIVRNDGGTPRSPRGCLWPKVAPLAGQWWAAGEAYCSCRGLLCQLLVGSSTRICVSTLQTTTTSSIYSIWEIEWSKLGHVLFE